MKDFKHYLSLINEALITSDIDYLTNQITPLKKNKQLSKEIFDKISLDMKEKMNRLGIIESPEYLIGTSVLSFYREGNSKEKLAYDLRYKNEKNEIENNPDFSDTKIIEGFINHNDVKTDGTKKDLMIKYYYFCSVSYRKK